MTQKKFTYHVALLNCLDEMGLPMSAEIKVDVLDKEMFEKFLIEEEGNIFAHAEGGNIEY